MLVLVLCSIFAHQSRSRWGEKLWSISRDGILFQLEMETLSIWVGVLYCDWWQPDTNWHKSGQCTLFSNCFNKPSHLLLSDSFYPAVNGGQFNSFYPRWQIVGGRWSDTKYFHSIHAKYFFSPSSISCLVSSWFALVVLSTMLVNPIPKLSSSLSFSAFMGLGTSPERNKHFPGNKKI